MSLLTARSFLAEHAPDLKIIELDESTATVALAADAHGVEPGQIAKTLAFKIGEMPLLVVTSGSVRIDNAKIRDVFGGKAKMLDAETVMELTSHPVGGVCPFGLAAELPVYCDISLKRHDEVLPAAGSPESAVRICPMRLAELVGAQWVDVCSPDDAP
ncbi:prolyl-tRNA editing enzyme YbaK/EbsC (Cys-tRNA(Pro) deacylase) [Vreelandella songnenensis]|uniref:Prolyl-tRNA editing enzyme YbaK/EbsC (Cys-tRNA(Pro) deacylase) n=1 Tax=Vreelandella songnenensis TaxID=1176243 RepID=A0A2T0V1X1_9GAMM|nr:YbaK/EbsC family protein [Halomonas songnenensis]PRY64154.1 prolyl-tRNA editing enzyme YbaK/EbsC (Cys-tRNA(Pro) deacylase) [Halomonas songnenensis]